MRWESLKLGEVMDVKHGYAFKSEFFTDSGQYVLLSPGNCHEEGGLKLKGDKEKYYSGEFPPEYLMSEGDMLVVMTDLINTAPILGGAFVIPVNNRFLHNQRLGAVQITDDQRIDKGFLYYLLNSHDYRAQVRGSASGATVRHTAPTRIKDCVVQVPTNVGYQKKIGDILSTYDDQIENNRRRMALLEESARLLYREWFVRLHFPGYEHTPIVDGVPQGWERKTLAQLAIFLKRGITPTYDDDAEGLVINQKCIRNGRVNIELARNQSKEVKPERLLQVGDVLVNSTGEGTLGRVAQVKAPIVNCTVDTHVTIVRFNKNAGQHYFGQAVMDWESRFSTMGKGATNQTELSPAAIGETVILVPSHTLQAQFEAFAEPLYVQVSNLAIQNQKLRTTRDLLLPRLMSGELAV